MLSKIASLFATQPQILDFRISLSESTDQTSLLVRQDFPNGQARCTAGRQYTGHHRKC